MFETDELPEADQPHDEVSGAYILLPSLVFSDSELIFFTFRQIYNIWVVFVLPRVLLASAK